MKREITEETRRKMAATRKAKRELKAQPIHLIDDFYVTADGYNFTLRRKVKTNLKDVGYYSTVEELLNGVLKYYDLGIISDAPADLTEFKDALTIMSRKRDEIKRLIVDGLRIA